MENRYLVLLLCGASHNKLKRLARESAALITFVPERAGHGRRNAGDAGKLKQALGYMFSITCKKGSDNTVQWYPGNEEWLNDVTSGHYQQYYNEQYSNR